ncbi:hypothetical protein [Rhizorhabdus argentea]|uniref:hypothetical protein n=1 Tax=Rhizorhabdus argentea TaxID=1387174 RepID=UPI0030EE373A
MGGHKYLFFFLNSDGHVTLRDDVVCRDDAEALEQACQLRYAHGVEVWKADQMIGKVQPTAGT